AAHFESADHTKIVSSRSDVSGSIYSLPRSTRIFPEVSIKSTFRPAPSCGAVIRSAKRPSGDGYLISSAASDGQKWVTQNAEATNKDILTIFILPGPPSPYYQTAVAHPFR